ncbi:MAG: exonuclease domain-containing protein [Defluviitaleaceae bacterium]|nr:exonuclease domain-containing protein [Defluviitaleaceae bacterium]
MTITHEKLSAYSRELQAATDKDAVWEIFGNLFNYLISMKNDIHNKDNGLLESALPLLGEIENKIHDSNLKHFIKALQFILADKKALYIAEIEQYIFHAKKHGDFSCEQSFSILDVIDWFSKDKAAYNSYIKSLSAALNKLMPQSAFCAYVKYKTKAYPNKSLEIKALRQILEINPAWHVAYMHLGDAYCEQKEWYDAMACYEAGINASDMWKDASSYFALAQVCDKTGIYYKAIENYLKCLECSPNYKYANNNLGYVYRKVRDYDNALLYFDKSIKLGTDGVSPFRNKLETLVRMKRTDEAIAFAKESPTHFTTKYCKELLTKAAEGQTADIFGGLEKTTANENAGTIEITDSHSGLRLYAHQQDAIRDMSSKILNKNEYAGLLVLPTGGGKTLTATYWLMGNILDSGHKVIWLAHRHELLNQARAGFEKVSYSDIARRKKHYRYRIISGQHDRPVHIKPSDDVLIASKTSLYRGFSHVSEKWLSHNNEVFLIIDEAHHATAKEYRELIEKIGGAVTNLKILGLTATPFRTAENEKGHLKKIFKDDIVYKIDLRELINRGILAEPIFEEVETHVDMEALFRSADAEDVLERIANDSFFDIETIGKSLATEIAENKDRNNAIVKKYTENKDKYGKTLVFALNVSMAIALNAVFREHGVESDYVVSSIKDGVTGVTLSDKRNLEIIEHFRSGALEVLINVNILTEGTDLPKVQTVFLTRPTKSTILMTQMIGRALRGVEAGGTKNAYIVSFVDDWHNRIAWVNPERLYIDTGEIPPNPPPPGESSSAMRVVAISKIEEFAKIADGTLEESVSRLRFIERIPVGIYKFSYLAPIEGDEDEAIYCDVLVYDCMQKAYNELFAWLPSADLRDVKSVAQHVNDVLFSETDRLIGYHMKDIEDIISYYKQTEELPELILFTERGDYDVAKLARRIIDEPAKEIQIMTDEWNNNNSRWSAFFGINNFTAFRMSIRHEKDKIQFPPTPAPAKPITQHEQRQIKYLPLEVIRQKFPELGEKLRTAVLEKYTDSEGYYFSAESGYRSKNKLDFQIDHINPMSNGGATVLENLQLLRRDENAKKGAKKTYVVFDIETTGFSEVKDKITEIGAAKIIDGKIIETFGELINPQVGIPSHITKITKITNDMVKNKKPISDVLPRFFEFCKGATMVAHHASFDVKFIKHNAKALGLEFNHEIVDTLSLARQLLPRLENHKLPTVAKALKIDLLNAHRAEDDAMATAEIFLRLMEMQAGLG